MFQRDIVLFSRVFFDTEKSDGVVVIEILGVTLNKFPIFSENGSTP